MSGVEVAFCWFHFIYGIYKKKIYKKKRMFKIEEFESVEFTFMMTVYGKSFGENQIENVKGKIYAWIFTL